MDHEFELAFNLCDEAAGRIQDQQYGITSILFHNHGPIVLTTIHEYTRETGHHLILLAHDDHGQMAAIEATAADLEDAPRSRILKVRAGELTFHAVPGRLWSYRATDGGDTYTLTAEVADRQPLWTTAFNDDAPTAHDDLDQAVAGLLANTAAAVA